MKYLWSCCATNSDCCANPPVVFASHLCCGGGGGAGGGSGGGGSGEVKWYICHGSTTTKEAVPAVTCSSCGHAWVQTKGDMFADTKLIRSFKLFNLRKSIRRWKSSKVDENSKATSQLMPNNESCDDTSRKVGSSSVGTRRRRRWRSWDLNLAEI